MNLRLVFIGLLPVVLISCSSSNKTTRMTDDVYYSPAAAAPIAKVKEREERQASVFQNRNDRQIVMSMHDPRWRLLYDDDARYTPYHYGYNYGYYYNTYYFPSPVYVQGAMIRDPKNTVVRMTNLGSYNYSNMVVMNPKTGTTQMIRSTRVYNNNNRDNYIRRIIMPKTNTYNPSNNNYRPTENNTRTYTPSNNNNNSSPSSGGSSGTPVARPGRRG